MRSVRHAASGQWGSAVRTRLLIVEDELSTVFAMREFFALAGYEVECAVGPADACRLLDAHGYEAVIADLHLTTNRLGEGMAVVAQARRLNPRACIVMLTGYGSETTPDEARRCGVDMYQTKPVELARLDAFVDLVLHGEVDVTRQAQLRTPWRHH